PANRTRGRVRCGTGWAWFEHGSQNQTDKCNMGAVSHAVQLNFARDPRRNKQITSRIFEAFVDEMARRVRRAVRAKISRTFNGKSNGANGAKMTARVARSARSQAVLANANKSAKH